MTEIVISLGVEFNVNTFENLLEGLLKQRSTQFSTLVFDMSQLKHVKLGGLINFLSLCGAIKEKKFFDDKNDIKIYLKLPSDKVLEHLHRMQFFKIASGKEWIEDCEALSLKDSEYFKKWKSKLNKYQNEIDPYKKRSYKSSFFPLHFIQLASAYSDFDNICIRFINDLIEVFESVLGYELNFSKEQKRTFWQSNRELYKNIFDHSKSWGLVAVQVDSKNVVFSYSDIGIGIMNSLEEYLMSKYKASDINDCLAIKEAIKKGISSKINNNDNMGLGLYLVSEYTKRSNGRMMIRSGECLYSLHSKPKRVNYFPGTQIHIAIPINKQRQ